MGSTPEVVLVRLSADRMLAEIRLMPAPAGGRPVSVVEVLNKLEEIGVVFGIDHQAIEAAIGGQSEAQGETWTVIARGQPPVPGRDGHVEYNPLLTAPTGVPERRADGTVDLFSLGLVRNVPAGTVLATRHPAQPGRRGMTVLGAAVHPPVPREAVLRLGKGTVFSADGLRLTARVAGHAVMQKDEVRVNAVYFIKEHVDPTTGNIEFIGSVVVGGDVGSGFWVKAKGDAEVRGTVDGGSVTADGSITVRQGCQGASKGSLTAGGNIRCLFIQNAEIKAGGDVLAPEGILHSQVHAGGLVSSLGRRGALIGGTIRAYKAVAARVIGSPTGTPTEVAVGLSPDLRQETEGLLKQRAEAEQKLTGLGQALGVLRQRAAKGQLSRDREEMLLRLVREEMAQRADLEVMQRRLAELEQLLTAPSSAGVEADLVFPGVRIVIGRAAYNVTTRLQRVRFHLNDDLEVTF